MRGFQNILELWIHYGCEYVRVTQDFELKKRFVKDD